MLYMLDNKLECKRFQNLLLSFLSFPNLKTLKLSKALDITFSAFPGKSLVDV